MIGSGWIDAVHCSAPKHPCSVRAEEIKVRSLRSETHHAFACVKAFYGLDMEAMEKRGWSFLDGQHAPGGRIRGSRVKTISQT